jgi:serine/threonine-protein kinase
MLTKSGAKLLDFGLAKLRVRNGITASGTTSAVTAAPVTDAGIILGTLPYMAPEQLEGHDADTRTDLFALGALIYEMATGVRAFHGDTQAGLIAAILERAPVPVRTLQPTLPRVVDDIVMRCLTKDPEERWQNAADLTFALRSASQEVSGSAGSPDAVQRAASRSLRNVLIGAGIGVVLASLAFALWLRRPVQIEERPPVTLYLSPQPLAALTENGPLPALAISPDGQRVVFVSEHEGVRRLYQRRLDTDGAAPLPGTDGAIQPFFSPDGSRIGFFADGHLKIVALGGGAPVVLAATVNGRGATWASDGTIIYSPGTDAGLWQVPAVGGTPRQLMAPDPEKGERSYRWPNILPGDDLIVFTLAMSQTLSFDDARIMVRSLRTGEQRELLRGGTFPVFVAPDLLLYARAGALLAVRFDPIRQEVLGTATTILDDLVTYPVNGGSQYALAANGTLVFAAGGSSTREAALTWFDRKGATTRLNVAPLPYNRVSLSKDGRQAALDIDGANASIWIMDLPKSAAPSSALPMTRLTLEWSNNLPFWMPNGTHVGFVSARRGIRSLFWQRVDGRGGPERLVTDHESDILGASPSPDGTTILYAERRQATGSDLWTIGVGGGAQPRPFLRTSFNEHSPQFSPDGKWIAYVSDESGQDEVFVQPYPGPGRKSNVSVGGGTEPLWSATGDELFYLNGDSIMAVRMATATALVSGTPQLLFKRRRAGSSGLSYAVAPDGRFLMIEDLPQRSSPVVRVVLDWLEATRRRVGGYATR